MRDLKQTELLSTSTIHEHGSFPFLGGLRGGLRGQATFSHCDLARRYGYDRACRKEDASMKVLKPDEIPAELSNSHLFTGGPVTRQTLLTAETSNNFNLAVVNFSTGARNKMHIHSSDQVLFVTAGKGIIATETYQEIITLGAVVPIPADERHWHGPRPP